MLQDLAALALIRQNIGKRSIYFSWSTGCYPDQTFGLSDNLVSQGFVRKLMPMKVATNDSIVVEPGGGLHGPAAHRGADVERLPLAECGARAAVRLDRPALGQRSCSSTA